MKNRFLNFLKISRSILFLVAPIIVGSLSNMLLSFVDMAIIGHIGVSALAAAATAIAIYSITSQVLLALTTGYYIRASQGMGSGRLSQVSNDCLHAAIILFSLSFLSLIIIIVFGKSIAALISSDSEVIRLAYEYLVFCAPSLLFITTNSIIIITFNAMLQTKIGMCQSLLTNLLNPIFSIPLAFGLGPIPAMGVGGCALGSTLATVAGFIFLSYIYFKQRPLPRPQWIWDAKIASDLVKLSYPEGINMLLDYVGNLIFISMIGLMGTIALAGGRIAGVLLMSLFIISMNFGSAIQIITGRSIGQHDFKHTLEYFAYARLVALTVLCCLGIIVYIASGHFVALFSKSQEVGIVARSAIFVIVITLPLMAWTTSHVGFLRALGYTKWVMYSNIIPVWLVQLPVAWFAIKLDYGLAGVYLAYFFYFLARAIAGHILARKGSKKFNGSQTIQTAPSLAQLPP